MAVRVFLTRGMRTHSQTCVRKVKTAYASSCTRTHGERQRPSFPCFEYGFLPYASLMVPMAQRTIQDKNQAQIFEYQKQRKHRIVHLFS